MLTCGIYFGEKTIWDEISENIKVADLEMDKAFDCLKGEMQEEKEPDEVDVLVESLLNYKDVLEGKVRELEQENEELHAEIERQDELIEKRDVEARTQQKILNTLRSRCSEKAVDYFDNQMWGMIEICRVGEKKECDCGDLKKQIEELQSEVRELTAENVKIGARNENLKKLLETCVEERDNLKNALHIKECGNVLGDKVFKELKEKYETADLEREHLKTELDRIKGTKKELEAALMATIGTVQRLSAELVKTGKE